MFESRPVLTGVETFLVAALSRGGGRQNGEADSDRSTWTISWGDGAGFLPLEDGHMLKGCLDGEEERDSGRRQFASHCAACRSQG
jgi:mono/diheme cytochrome c family protein